MAAEASVNGNSETEIQAQPAKGKALAFKTAMVMYLASLVLGGAKGVFANAVSLPSLEKVIISAAFAAALLGMMLVAGRQPLQLLRYKREAALVLLAGLFLAGDWAFLFEAYDTAGVGLATILRYCGPAFVMLLSPLVFREKLTASKLIGFGIVVIGAVLVNGVALQGGSIHGIACGLVSAVCFGMVIVVNKKIVHVVGVEKVFLEIGLAAVVLALFGFLVKGVTFEVQGSDVLPLIALSAVTAISNYLYLRGMEGIPVQSVSVLGYLEPLSAVFFGMLLLGETMVPVQALGAAFIIGGALLCEAAGFIHLPKAHPAVAEEAGAVPSVAVAPSAMQR